MSGNLGKRIESARKALCGAIASLETHRYAEAMTLATIAGVHLSHVTGDKDFARIIDVLEGVRS